MKIYVLYQRTQMGIKEKRRGPRKKGAGAGTALPQQPLPPIPRAKIKKKAGKIRTVYDGG